MLPWLKLQLHLQRAGHALADARIALYAKVKAERRLVPADHGDAYFPYARSAGQIRGGDAVAVNAGVGFAVQLMLIGRPGIGNDMFGRGKSDAPARAQAVRIQGIEFERIARDVHGIAFPVGPEILARQVQSDGVVDLPDVADPGMQTVVGAVRAVVRVVAESVGKVR